MTILPLLAGAGLEVGDRVPFHPDLHAATWRVIGVAVDSNGLGLTFGVMLAPIAEANRFQGLPADYASAVLIDSTSRMDVPFAFNPMSLVLMLLFILAVATIASVIPVWGASRLRIAQTLRYDG